MLAKQRNASELYIELQTAAELQPCFESEVAKFMDHSKMEQATQAQENCQRLHSEDDSEDSSSRYVDSPKRDAECVKQSLQLVPDDTTLRDVRFLSSPAEVVYNLEKGSPFLPDFFSLHSTSKPEEITEDFPGFNNN